VDSTFQGVFKILKKAGTLSTQNLWLKQGAEGARARESKGGYELKVGKEKKKKWLGNGTKLGAKKKKKKNPFREGFWGGEKGTGKSSKGPRQIRTA